MPSDRDLARALRSVAANIGRFRRERGLTQAALAEQLGIDVKHLQRIESGSRAPSLRLFIRIAVELEISPAQLFAPVSLLPVRLGRPPKH